VFILNISKILSIFDFGKKQGRGILVWWANLKDALFITAAGLSNCP